MCQTVWYSYSCGHPECVVYRCRDISDNPSKIELYDCVKRAASGGAWRSCLCEPCHDCIEAERLRQEMARRSGRAAPANLAGRNMSNGTMISHSASAPNVGEMQNQQYAAPQQPLVRYSQRGRDGSSVSPFSMNWARRMIRPLETSFLSNIGRITLDGIHYEDVTPAEIWEAGF